MNQLTKEQNAVLDLTSFDLFNFSCSLEDISWEKLRKEAFEQAVFLHVYSAVKKIKPNFDFTEWEDLCEKVTAKNLTMDYEHTELHGYMEEASIPYTVIKGSSSAAYYEKPLERMMGDVDFIVREDDLQKSSQVLKDKGFVRTEDTDHQSHIAFSRDLSTWELHYKIGGIPNDKNGETINYYLKDLIENAILYEQDGRLFRIPSIFHHGLILLIHTADHCISTGIGLRHLCDWAVFANNISDEDFISLFEKKLRGVGLWKFACILTMVSERYLHIRHCRWVNSVEKPTEEFFEKFIFDIFSGGNFGNKDKQRLNQSKLIFNNESGKMDKNGLLGNLFSSLNAKSRIKMPIIKKVPILMPIGWIYTFGWYVGLMIQGKRPSINVKEMVKGAEERRLIYKDFKLFEIE